MYISVFYHNFVCIHLLLKTHIAEKFKKGFEKGKNRTKRDKKGQKNMKDHVLPKIQSILGKKSPPQYCVCSYMLLKDTHSRW